MRARLRHARCPAASLTPAECRRRSRATLVSRVMCLVMRGESLATIARREHMPRYATFTRWLQRDREFRRRRDIALDLRLDVAIDDMIAVADRAAASARGKHRLAAVRQQIAARKLGVDLLRARRDRQERGANKRGASWGASPDARWGADAVTDAGVADAHVAILDAALAKTEGATEADAVDKTLVSSSSPKGEDPRVSFEVAKTRGWSASADHDEKKNVPAAQSAALQSRNGLGATGPRSDHDGKETNAAPAMAPAAPPDPPPAPFVPRWFNEDDLRRPNPPWDPLA